MEIRQLKAFVAIAEAKTFTAGARRVNVTQAAISMQIRQLEDELGMPIFTRTPRRVILTEAGERLLDAGAKDTDRTRFGYIRDRRACRCRIRPPADRFGVGDVRDAAAAGHHAKAAREVSECRIDGQLGTSADACRQDHARRDRHGIHFVSGRELERRSAICFLATRSSRSRIRRIRWQSEKFISAATLAGEKLILGERGGNTRRMIDEFFNAANVQPNVVMELSRQEAINQMVENNLGVGIAGAKTVAKEIREGQLISWMIEGAEIKWELGLARLAADTIRRSRKNL